jgi:hypothetical protein
MAELRSIYFNETSGDDVIIGTSGNDHIDAWEGNDTVYGLAGNDTLFGWTGNDFIDGGDGDDWIFGEGGTDILTGGAGNDIFGEFDQWHNGDTITDFSIGDMILIRDADIATFAFTLEGELLTFTGAQTAQFQGGTMILLGAAGATLVASAYSEGGVQITMTARPAIIPDSRSDFNGDGRSDILWRNADGTVGDWLANANGTFTSNGASVTGVPAYWTIVGTGDFNGDGKDDILWRGAGGEVGDWLAAGNGSGAFAYNAAGGVTTVSTSWQIEGIGDFNGDGKDDILWRNTDGTVGTWSGRPNGGFTANNAAVFNVTTDWQIAAVGDFNGDGRDDILWRHSSGTIANWLAQPNGAFAPNNASLAGISTDWQIVGTGDFNGDRRDDILWRHTDGTIANWTANHFGVFSPNTASLVGITNDWNIAAIGDYNGDGRDDILWRHDSGTVADWLASASANGTFVPNNASIVSVPNDWIVQAPDVQWV